MRRLLHALFACALLVAGMGLGSGPGPAPAPHACCGGLAPTLGGGCPCPQSPATPGLAPAPLAAPVQLEAVAEEAVEPTRPGRASDAGSAEDAAPGTALARAPALHRRLALLRCWRT